jgi:hypothetical protein
MTLGAADPNNPKVLDPNSRIAPVLDADHSDIVEPHAFAVWTFAAAAWRVTSLLVSWQRGGGGKACDGESPGPDVSCCLIAVG